LGWFLLRKGRAAFKCPLKKKNPILRGGGPKGAKGKILLRGLPRNGAFAKDESGEAKRSYTNYPQGLPPRDLQDGEVGSYYGGRHLNVEEDPPRKRKFSRMEENRLKCKVGEKIVLKKTCRKGEFRSKGYKIRKEKARRNS